MTTQALPRTFEVGQDNYPTVAIVGYGHVGRAMHRIFPVASIFDSYLPEHAEDCCRDAVQKAEVAFVCVPTPRAEDGSADISAVREVVGWLDAPLICIKSTIPPGTTYALRGETGKRITFSPEYEGETPWQRAAPDWPYVIVGGARDDANAVLAYFQRALGPEKSYWATDARTAELVKYMENAWLAMQVTFANEFYEIARAVIADYNEARELWALDPRVGGTHTLVFEDARGYGGRCLPKDVDAIIASAKAAGYWPSLLHAMREANERFQR